MTIKELYEKSENIREWDVCVDGGVCASIDVLTEIVTG